MKATLEFNLVQEEEDFFAAACAMDMKHALHEVDMMLRALLKHGTPNEESAKVAEDCRQVIGEILMKVEA